MINETDYVELGLTCVDICNALAQGMGGRQPGNLSGSVSNAITNLTK